MIDKQLERRAKQAYSETESVIDDLIRNIEDLESERDNARDEIDSLNKKIEELESENSDLRSEISEINPTNP